MIRTFELAYADEIDKIARKIYNFSCEWDSGEYSDSEWEAIRWKESEELAMEIIKTIKDSDGRGKK